MWFINDYRMLTVFLEKAMTNQGSVKMPSLFILKLLSLNNGAVIAMSWEHNNEPEKCCSHTIYGYTFAHCTYAHIYMYRILWRKETKMCKIEERRGARPSWVKVSVCIITVPLFYLIQIQIENVWYLTSWESKVL